MDFEGIAVDYDGYVYYWELSDFAKPPLEDRLSFTTYNQVDCNLFRYKQLSWDAYKQPMAKGDISASGKKPEKNWTYVHPNSAGELILKTVCDYVESNHL